MKDLKRWSLGWLGICLCCTILVGQHAGRLVDLHYDNEPLGQVLMDISKRYAVRFSYSTNFVPINKQINVHANQVPLTKGLDLIFENTKVIYAYMGEQYVLKIDPNKELMVYIPKRSIRIPRLQPKKLSVTRKRINDIPRPRPGFVPVNPLKRIVVRKVPGGGDQFFAIDRNLMTFIPLEEYNKQLDDTRIAQISLFSFVGSNAKKSAKMTNNVSFNLLWGTNGGVRGLEVGGLVNSIRNDVKGVQVAGLGNYVGGEVIGTQFGGLFNVSQGIVGGVQIGGLFNTAGGGDAAQLAGLFNIAGAEYSGIQAAGLFNVTGKGDNVVQLSGLYNTSGGEVTAQVSGLFNVAGNVSYGQISGLLNVGKRVDGFQIGLINVSDTISGMPIGLLNIVRNGYNRFEMGSGEVLFFNVGAKLGAYSFYNIFNVGAQWEEQVDNSGPEPETTTALYWSLGYGIGTAFRLGGPWLLNVELQSHHVNEGKFWTTTLNQLNQFKLLFSVRVGRTAAFYAGPVANVMVSKLYDPETGLYGSNIMPYTMYDETNNNTNVKGWIGFNVGVRL
ncbi:MAG: hypothetical protein AAF798_03165 [Bacteroidota bacterium]